MKWRWLFILFILVFLSGCENPQLHLHNVFKSIDLEVRSHSQAYPLYWKFVTVMVRGWPEQNLLRMQKN